jgi:hypothetical protein
MIGDFMNYLDTVRNLTRMAASSQTAAAIFNHFASRKRGRKVETVRRLIQVCGNGTPRRAVIEVLRQLESNGFGRVVVGRRGHESRFEWAEV